MGQKFWTKERWTDSTGATGCRLSFTRAPQNSLWLRRPATIRPIEYDDFYCTLAKDDAVPMAVKHVHCDRFMSGGQFAIEGGPFEIYALLYVPARSSLGSRGSRGPALKSHKQLQLYVSNAHVPHCCDDLLPSWLNMIWGLVDIADIDFYVARGSVREHKVRVLRELLTGKCLEMFEDLTKSKGVYAQFYTFFADHLELGAYKDTVYRKQLVELLRFTTTKSLFIISLKEYVERMKDKQKYIFYIPGTSRVAAPAPIMNWLDKQGIEAMHVTSPIAVGALQRVSVYCDIPFRSTVEAEHFALQEAQYRHEQDRLEQLAEQDRHESLTKKRKT